MFRDHISNFTEVTAGAGQLGRTNGQTVNQISTPPSILIICIYITLDLSRYVLGVTNNRWVNKNIIIVQHVARV